MITLRSAGADDDAFLQQIYASMRAGEMALMGFDAAQATAFLQMQFRAQTQSYRLQFPNAITQIVLQDAVAIGRLIVDRGDEDILLIDIALLPAHRNQGIGTQLIRALQDAAAVEGRAVRLHVDPANPARRLYQRLGFIETEAQAFTIAMRWRPSHNP